MGSNDQFALQTSWITHVRFGSEADIDPLATDVRLPPKADIVQHDRDVRFVPIGDITPLFKTG
jgi:hypothetical protein